MFGELIPEGGGDPIPLLKTKLRVGRREDCDVCLRFPNISSYHCELELLDGFWRIRDLGSSNGTKVNGARLTEGWILPGDRLSIARHHYEVKYTASGTPPAIEEERDPLRIGLLEKAGLAGYRRAPSPPIKSRPAAGGPTRGHEPASADSHGFANGSSPHDAAETFRLDDELPGEFTPAPPKPAAAAAKKKPESDESIALKFLDEAGG